MARLQLSPSLSVLSSRAGRKRVPSGSQSRLERGWSPSGTGVPCVPGTFCRGGRMWRPGAWLPRVAEGSSGARGPGHQEGRGTSLFFSLAPRQGRLLGQRPTSTLWSSPRHTAPAGRLAAPCVHTPLGQGLCRSGGGGRGHWDSEAFCTGGGFHFWGLCDGVAPPLYSTLPWAAFFFKTSLLRYFTYHKICPFKVVSSLLSELCSHHHSLILEPLNSPQRSHAHYQSPPVPLSPQPQVTLVYFFLYGVACSGKFI